MREKRSKKRYVFATVGTLSARKFLIKSAPGEIRTPDLLVRSQALYPTELRAQGREYYHINWGSPSALSKHILAEREGFEPSKGF